MDKLESLVQISQYYGKNPAYVIAGGGNTSYKNSEKLFIKASGVSLATIDTDGFVVMSRERLDQMEHKVYAEDAVQREEEVKEDLKKAIICPEHLRPSVETSLHNLIDYSYVIHTHPTSVNALMCANDAETEVEERFGSEALYVEYTDPGYVLYKKIRDQIRAYKEQYQTAPQIIFLQNHGIFVGANSAYQVKAIYDSIASRIRERRDLSLPEGEIVEHKSKASKFVAEKFTSRGLVVRAFNSPLIQHFSADQDMYQLVNRPFTPDIIVYCKSNYLFLKKGLDGKSIGEALETFETDYGYYPKVIVEEQGGLILTEESEKSVQTVLEVFYDMLKISYLSNQYGGPHFMTDEQIRFIDNWEVENYRRSVAKTV
jgi:rhamnose utilization protein RhaD (predicted bifunctional aldolase and dehydrogenase)